MKPLLIAYATTYVSTREVADAIAATPPSECYDASNGLVVYAGGVNGLFRLPWTP